MAPGSRSRVALTTVLPATVILYVTDTVGGVEVAVAAVRVQVPVQLCVVDVVPGVMVADSWMVVPPPSSGSVIESVGVVSTLVI
jgi:hypothetical protein